MTDAERRQLLLAMDLVTTADLRVALRCSRATVAKMHAAGLRRYGIGKDRFYRLSEVPAVLAAMNQSEDAG